MSEPKQLVTIDGVPVTEELVVRLVAEAEAGFDVSLLKARGRPRLGVGPSEIVPVRLDAELRTALIQRAASEETTQSDVIRRALRAYLHVA